jgi:hypothetical protein
MYEETLDLRELASDWRSLVEVDETADTTAYVVLCGDLGIATSADALEEYGESYEPTLIAEWHFTEYAQELAEDIAPFPSGSREMMILEQWPYRCIDWEQAARELRYDYTTVRFDGNDYLIRSC